MKRIHLRKMVCQGVGSLGRGGRVWLRFKPSRTIYFCFGHDEEVGGQHGAASLAKLLQERGVELDFLLDEGGNVMTDGIPPLTGRPIAVVSTAEKVTAPALELLCMQSSGYAAHKSEQMVML